MIQAIGLMIGAYIFTRMWELLLKDKPVESGAVLLKIMAAATVIITAVCIFLIMGGIAGLNIESLIKK